MNETRVNQIADAVLYEGYILYPYRPSTKNRRRWTFGGLLPRNYSEAHGGFENWWMKTQCLVSGSDKTCLSVRVRFLHLMDRTVGRLDEPVSDEALNAATPAYQPVEALEVEDERYQSWQEAVEREVRVDPVPVDRVTEQSDRVPFTFPGSRDYEPIHNQAGEVAALLIREQQPIEGVIDVSAEAVMPSLHRVTVTVHNTAALDDPGQVTRDQALTAGLASTHIVLALPGTSASPETDGEEPPAGEGGFVSLMDPPVEYRDAVEHCDNRGCWPVLVGEEGESDTMLSSPIILYDYPQLAPESPGSLFDSTEIDEMLSLRIMTLTDEEKREAAATDDEVRRLLERTESLSDDNWINLHGAMRQADTQPSTQTPAAMQTVESETQPNEPMQNGQSRANEQAPDQSRQRSSVVHPSGVSLQAGDRVRINPKGNADAFDVVLRGMTATINSIEEDFENRTHLAVTIDADPGADYGRAGQPGHRFFFDPDDVEPLRNESGVHTA